MAIPTFEDFVHRFLPGAEDARLTYTSTWANEDSSFTMQNLDAARDALVNSPPLASPPVYQTFSPVHQELLEPRYNTGEAVFTVPDGTGQVRIHCMGAGGGGGGSVGPATVTPWLEDVERTIDEPYGPVPWRGVYGTFMNDTEDETKATQSIKRKKTFGDFLLDKYGGA